MKSKGTQKINAKIILASGSPQRKALLRWTGLPFTVKPSRVEEHGRITSNCADLVRKNAVLKAEDVAGRTKEGIIIGADTVVYIGNKHILGKPRNQREARQTLKILFSSARWVYTGIAVVDARSGIKAVSYEKTRVFMNPLSDEEITRYHKKVAPYDKAGGFDIEGYGCIFIKRIEGCYTNVIGLPMAKLAVMLKEFGINLLG